ncbi:hypothetical protein RHSIM_Rhsim02G0153000 [Rhododendron simsii]|uniref:Uncharacterized protein n=1 Tax=Rhododendron simsii TaxID=118357 RepID=A0A834LWA0_RHOSS|nr:hypothetical protein RHSIM_Rhsim02G0153000 [Rhododendron simsii]
MVLLQYLISVLEGDFVPRNSVFKENMDWNLLRVSLLNMILGSRRISYKDLIKGCLSIICEMSHLHAEHSDDMTLPKSSSAELFKLLATAGAISFPEVRKCSFRALQKFLLMAMELDTSRKEADIQGLTTRADGVRTPVVEIIQDELTYNRDAISPFFQVFNEPQWKMEILLQYFQKYIAKVSDLLIFHNKPMQIQITTKGSRFVMSSRLGSFSMMFSCCFQSEVLENPLEFEFRRMESYAPFIVSSSFIS